MAAILSRSQCINTSLSRANFMIHKQNKSQKYRVHKDNKTEMPCHEKIVTGCTGVIKMVFSDVASDKKNCQNSDFHSSGDIYFTCWPWKYVWMPHTNDFVHTPGSDYVCSCTVIECIHTLRYRHTANLPEIVTEMVKCQNKTMSRTKDCFTDPCLIFAWHWRHNDHNHVSNHQPHDCLLSRLFRHRSKKTSKLRVTGLCAGIHRDRWIPAQMASNAKNVSIW